MRRENKIYPTKMVGNNFFILFDVYKFRKLHQFLKTVIIDKSYK